MAPRLPPCGLRLLYRQLRDPLALGRARSEAILLGAGRLERGLHCSHLLGGGRTQRGLAGRIQVVGLSKRRLAFCKLGS